MKLVTFCSPTGPRLGALVENTILDLQQAHVRLEGQEHPALTSMQSLIESGGLSLAQLLLESHRPSDVIALKPRGHLMAPIPTPIQIRDTLCFWDHLRGVFKSTEELGSDVRERERALKDLFARRPFWYTANRFSVIGPDEIVKWPSYSSEIDYELEMGIVIGKGGCNIAPENAREHIFGYTIFNDFTARDTQRIESAFGIGFSKSKGFDRSNGLGPCIVTADEFEPYTARMVARINDEIQCDNNASTINRRFEDVISWLSKDETLHPGEIFCSGTVGGGCGLETGRLLADGDIVELEIVGIGKLRHQIHSPHTRSQGP